MRTNSQMTLYHYEYNPITRLNYWTRKLYNNVLFQGGKGAGINKGYKDANDVNVRIPYNSNENADINDFAIRRYNL